MLRSSGLLLLVLRAGPGLAAGCADDHAARSRGEGGVDPDAGSSDASDIARAEPPTQAGPLCKAVCAAAEPDDHSAPHPCEFASLAECEKACARAVEDTDRSCGECIANAISWEPARGGCNDWECSCTGGEPDFSGARCREACAATEARRAQTRLNATTPKSTGHQPETTVELTEVASVGCLSTHGDAVWLAADGRYGGRLAHLTSGLEVDWASSPSEAIRGCNGLTTTADGDAILLAPDDNATQGLARYSARGEMRFGVIVSDKPPFISVAMRDPETVQLRSVDGRSLNFDTKLGVRLDAAPPPAMFQGAVAAAARDAQGGVVLGGTLAGHGLVVAYDGAGTRSYEWRSSAGETSAVRSVAVDAQGFVAVGGGLYVKKPYGTRGGSVSHGTPFVARLSPTGDLLWQWQFDASTIVGGGVNAVTVDAQGNVYSVGTEDPTTDPTRDERLACTVYGCDGLVVRKFAPDGQQLWEYQHRSATSRGLAVGLDAQGRVVAAGQASREDALGLVLRFAPD